MKIYEYIVESKDCKIQDFIFADNKKQATQKIKQYVNLLGYQKPKSLTFIYVSKKIS